MKFCTLIVNVLQKVQKIPSCKLKDSNTTPLTLQEGGLKSNKKDSNTTPLTLQEGGLKSNKRFQHNTLNFTGGGIKIQ